jgi:hypothetical protein
MANFNDLTIIGHVGRDVVSLSRKMSGFGYLQSSTIQRALLFKGHAFAFSKLKLVGLSCRKDGAA